MLYDVVSEIKQLITKKKKKKKKEDKRKDSSTEINIDGKGAQKIYS